MVYQNPYKRAKLVFLRKGDKPIDKPSSYRPLFMLDTTGKLFERILCNRIEGSLEIQQTELSENQYGFRKGRYNVCIRWVPSYERGNGCQFRTTRQWQLCVLVTLDVTNAFNSAS